MCSVDKVFTDTLSRQLTTICISTTERWNNVTSMTADSLSSLLYFVWKVTDSGLKVAAHCVYTLLSTAVCFRLPNVYSVLNVTLFLLNRCVLCDINTVGVV